MLKKTLRFLTRKSRLQNYGDNGEIKYNEKTVLLINVCKTVCYLEKEAWCTRFVVQDTAF